MRLPATEPFAPLWQDLLDGGLDAARFAELERLLRADARLVEAAGERHVEHRLLGLALRREEPGRFVAATLTRIEGDSRAFSQQVRLRLEPPSRRSAWPHALAAALVAALAIAAAWRAAPPPPTSAGYVATLAIADRCAWDGPALVQGQRLPGGPLRLRAGDALLRFDGGAEVLLRGEVDLRLDSAGGGTLTRGRVTVRAGEEAAGFVLRTPSAEVTDLGTEFALAVDPSGATDIQVLEGEVSWRGRRAAASAPAQVLVQGQALRLRSADDAAGEAMTPTAQRFAEQLGRLRASDGGTLHAYEPFDYPFAVTASRERAAAGGSGWRGPWYRNRSDTDLTLHFARPGLPMPAGFAATSGGLMELPVEAIAAAGRDACMRLLATPIDLRSDGVAYLSMLALRSGRVRGQRNQWLRCMLTSSEVPSDRLGFAVLTSGLPQLICRDGNTAGAAPLPEDGVCFVVLKIVAGRAAPDQLFLKVYGPGDPVDRQEPAAWTVVGRPSRYDAVLSGLHINNGVDRAYAVDELRIGSSWSAVTPRP